MEKSGLIGIVSLPFSAGSKVSGSGKPILPWEAPFIPNPIRKVLFTIRKHHVRSLLMGGQACVFYGAAEFSRDTDLAILADDENLARLREALEELEAVSIEVPSFEPAYLHAGHAIHFRCQHPDAAGMRVDIMSRMRGVDEFSALWERRTTFEMPDGLACDLLSLPDLVAAKKTQRDKDWPMIRRLVEAHHFAHRADPNSEQIAFWFRELRTSSLLTESTRTWPDVVSQCMSLRPLLRFAQSGDERALSLALEEERVERALDREYWLPLKHELEQLRRNRKENS